jgi:drug/metabolite transporter (DMT)-like permease
MSSRPSEQPVTAARAVKASSRARRTIFRSIAVIMAVSGAAFGLFTAVFGIVGEGQEIHAFHNAVVATLLLVLSAPAAIAATREPERSTGPLIHLAMVGVAGLITMALSLTLDPFTLPFVVLVGVLWALRPSREQSFPRGRPSPILLLLVAGAAVPLVAYALGQAELQRIDSSSEHAEFYHWVETSFCAVAILLLGLLVAVRPAASRLSGWSAGVALAVLGVASLLLPGRASALETPWAWAALAGSLVFVSVAEWERRRLRVAPIAGPG